MTDFASGFRAGVEAAANKAASMLGEFGGLHPLPAALLSLQPPQQPDAPTSPAVAAWQALDNVQRAWITQAIDDYKTGQLSVARTLPHDQGMQIIAAKVRNASEAALDLLRSLAPEAGDADGGR